MVLGSGLSSFALSQVTPEKAVAASVATVASGLRVQEENAQRRESIWLSGIVCNTGFYLFDVLGNVLVSLLSDS